MEAPPGRSRSIGLPPQPTPASRTFFCSCFPFTRSVARSSSMSVALGRASTPRALIQLRSCQPAPTVDIRTSRFAQSPPGDACPQDGQRPQSRDGVSAKHGGYPGVRPRDSRASSPTRGSRTTRSRGGTAHDRTAHKETVARARLVREQARRASHAYPGTPSRRAASPALNVLKRFLRPTELTIRDLVLIGSCNPLGL